MTFEPREDQQGKNSCEMKQCLKDESRNDIQRWNWTSLRRASACWCRCWRRGPRRSRSWRRCTRSSRRACCCPSWSPTVRKRRTRASRRRPWSRSSSCASWTRTSSWACAAPRWPRPWRRTAPWVWCPSSCRPRWAPLRACPSTIWPRSGPFANRPVPGSTSTPPTPATRSSAPSSSTSWRASRLARHFFLHLHRFLFMFKSIMLFLADSLSLLDKIFDLLWKSCSCTNIPHFLFWTNSEKIFKKEIDYLQVKRRIYKVLEQFYFLNSHLERIFR